MQLTEDSNNYKTLQNLIEEEFGLSLKTHTPESFIRKLQPRLKTLKMTSIREYLHYIQNDPLAKLELQDLPSFIMNTESYFLREFEQFELFLALLRQKRKERALQNRKIKILSAGCSDGQEPYSIAMLLRNEPEPLYQRNTSIFGLDINLLTLEKARSGVYSSYAMRSPQIDLIKKYFQKTTKERCETPGKCFKLEPEIISSVEYLHGNILRPLVLKGLVDLDFIFCRNVLMYMSRKAVESISFSLWEALSDDGYLFVSQSETLCRTDNLFVPVKFPGITVYRKKASKKEI